MRPWIVWATGLLAYIVAVLDRTTLGVSGLEAGDRFAASPGVLSSFVVLQIVVYAGAQVPAGLLLDRFGSKALILSGADADGGGPADAGVHRVAARRDRGPRGGRTRRRGHIHLGAAAGAALVHADDRFRW